MLRRNPTRIELKLEDIKEYETMKTEKLKQTGPKPMSLECASSGDPCEGATAMPGPAVPGASGTDLKTKAQLTLEIHERIGYDPKPQLGTSRVRAPIPDLLR